MVMTILSFLFRDVMVKGQYIHGLMVMVEAMMMTVQLMDILKVYTPSLLELLV